MNKLFRKLHLWLSVPVGLIITVVCLSGAALVFEREIVEMSNPHLYQTAYRKGMVPLKPSELAEYIRQQMPDTLQLSSLQYSGSPEGVCIAGFKNAGRRTLSVNPYTGEVNGWVEGNSFFQTMRKLHRWLMDVPPKKGDKTVGKAVVGVTTLIMVVILVSGLIVWIPRNRKVLKNRLKVSCTKGWRRFWYDSHVALGFYATIFLLVMALTGLTWSFSWYRTAAYSLFGVSQQTAQSSQPGHKEKESGRKGKTETVAFDYTLWNHVWEEIREIYPVYTSVRLNSGNVQIVTDNKGGVRKTDAVNFNPQNGEVNEIIRYNDLPKSQKIKSWFYAFHTGTWGGIWTKILYFLTSLTGGILPLSGYYLWLKKKRKKSAR